MGLTRVSLGLLTATVQQWLTPVATVIYSASATLPAGYLACDGSAVSRTTYAALFAVIGTTYGAGNGTTTFNLPNAQGIFIRGVGSQTISGQNYSGTLGASNKDSTAKNGLSLSDPSHAHQQQASVSITSGGTGTLNRGDATSRTTAATPNVGLSTVGATTGISLTGDAETAPANICFSVFIKY